MSSTAPPASSRADHFQRVLGGLFAATAVIGATVGGGILYTPGKIAALLPDPRWYFAVWVLGGVNALLGATVFAELGAMIPSNGGTYAFARRALGEYAGFFVGYTVWMLYCAATAALLLLVGEYLGALVPPLAGHSELVAFGVLVTLCALNWQGVREGGRFQVATTLAKTIALFALVGAALLHPATGSGIAPAATAGPTGGALAIAMILAMQGIIFTYDSYYCAIYFSEEITDPGRAVPRAIFRGLAVIIPVYLLLNLAFLRVVPIAQMAHNPFVGGTAAQTLFGAWGDPVIRTIVVVSVLGTLNTVLMVAARLLFAMGRDGLFAHAVTRINRGGTPTPALALTAVVTAAFLLSGSFNAVLGVTALLMALNYVLAYVSLLVLRVTEPGTARPYRAWGYPWTTIAALAIGVVFVAGVALNDPHNGWLAVGLLALSYPLYRGTRRLFRATR